MTLDELQVERYSRHIILPEVGGKGQEKLLRAKVLIVGAGGLGSPVAMYLAAAGVGQIGLIDGDVVDLSNLQRQIAHFTADLGVPKVESAADKLRLINPDVKVDPHQCRLNAENAAGILAPYDFVIDGTDNFASKFLVADACHFAGKPYSHAGVLRFDGQTLSVIPGETACYRCVFNGPPPQGAVPSCSQAGVLGVLPGVIGCIQATEAVKSILEIGKMLHNRMLIYHALEMRFREARFGRDPNCPLCGGNPSITRLVDGEQATCDLRG